MKTSPTRKPERETRKAYHVANCGREKVSIYRRIAPNGSPCYMVANYSTGKRRFDSYADESLAIEAATKLARQMSERQVIAAAMTNEQAQEYASAVQKVKPFNVGLLAVADAVAEVLRIIGGFKDMDAVKIAAAQGQPLPELDELKTAAKFYRERRQKITAKRVADVVAELIAMKKARGKSPRHVRDLSSRLNCFADVFKRDIGNVTTADVQGWLDGLKLSARSVKNYRAALASLFGFAESRGYVFKGGNPVRVRILILPPSAKPTGSIARLCIRPVTIGLGRHARSRGPGRPH
jgi:hypothetical protein